MKIGFIGCGNMATAIIKGLLQQSGNTPDELSVFDVSEQAAARAADNYGVMRADTIDELIQNNQIIILAVKPQVISTVLTEHARGLGQLNPLLISIAAGKTLSFLEKQLDGNPCRIVRVMPNINAKVGEAMCGYCTNALVTQADEVTVKTIFGATGGVLKVEEKHFPIFSVLAGCGPAFAYLFIDALARAGVQNGLSKQESLQIAAQTVLGSAKMILESGEHPWALIDQVCSPGGTTIEAVTSLQADGLEAAVHHAVNKAVEKDKKL